MRSYISNSKVIIFPINSRNELKAITKFDSKAYVKVSVFEEAVMISFNNSYTSEEFERNVTDLITECEETLRELEIPFKTIEVKF